MENTTTDQNQERDRHNRRIIARNDFNNNIPGGEWLEYDAAADWCAARGIRGGVRDPLPENLSDRAMEIINADTDAFERRVREHAYLRSMTGPRAVTIIKSDESHNQ